MRGYIVRFPRPAHSHAVGPPGQVMIVVSCPPMANLDDLQAARMLLNTSTADQVESPQKAADRVAGALHHVLDYLERLARETQSSGR